MSFKDSCVTKLTPYSVLEEASTLPEHIFPVYIGSGSMVLSVDASGMQGLNHGAEKQYGGMPGSGDMYLVRYGRTSNHLSRGKEMPEGYDMNALPYGYLTWNTDVTGETVCAENLKDHACKIERLLDFQQGLVRTGMILDRKTHVTWELCMPLHTDCLMLRLLVNHDPGWTNAQTPETAGTMRVQLHMQTRDGIPLYDEARLTDSTLRLRVQGTEQYEDTVHFSSDMPVEAELKEDCLNLSFAIGSAWEAREYTLLLDFGGQRKITDLEALLTQNAADRQEIYRNLASFEGLDPEEGYIYNLTQYLLMSCFRYDTGLPIAMPFYFTKWWRAGTFWDSHYVMDGLMRSGGRKQADDFVRFLHRVMHPEGKPFSWIVDYQGRPCVPPEQDNAPVCMCAHAMTALKHYEYYHDKAFLEAEILPILERVTGYASEHLFSREADGKWIVGKPVTHDTNTIDLGEINQTYTIVWFLTIFAKTCEYQRLVGKEPSARVLDILQNYRLEHSDEEYYHARGAAIGSVCTWEPFLCYPTEGMPFLDMDLMNRTREKYCFSDIYVAGGSYQPWTEFIEASSDFRRGAVEEGYRIRRMGMSRLHGIGFFTEGGACANGMCGMPPYISAHGSFLTALFYQFVGTSIWNHQLEIFARLPRHYEGRALRVRNLLCSGVRILEARMDGQMTEARLRGEGTEGTCGLEIRIPEQAEVQPRVLVNGREVPCTIDPARRTAALMIPVSETAETIIQVL